MAQGGPIRSLDPSYNIYGGPNRILIMSKRLKRTPYDLTRMTGSSRTSYTIMSHLSSRFCVDGDGFGCPWPSEFTMVQTTSGEIFPAGKRPLIRVAVLAWSRWLGDVTISTIVASARVGTPFWYAKLHRDWIKG